MQFTVKFLPKKLAFDYKRKLTPAEVVALKKHFQCTEKDICAEVQMFEWDKVTVCLTAEEAAEARFAEHTKAVPVEEYYGRFAPESMTETEVEEGDLEKFGLWKKVDTPLLMEAWKAAGYPDEI